jgi:predicted SprT family Zn-dependent metalloprotease
MNVEEVANDLGVLEKVSEVADSYCLDRNLILSVQVIHAPRLKRIYGDWCWTKNQIRLAEFLQNDTAELSRTFLHEVAHAIHHFSRMPGKGHGMEWKEVARGLGIKKPRASSSVKIDGMKESRPNLVKEIGNCMVCNHVYTGRKLLSINHVFTCTQKGDSGEECGGVFLDIVDGCEGGLLQKNAPPRNRGRVIQ